MRGQVGLIDRFAKNLFANRARKGETNTPLYGQEEDLRELHNAVASVRDVLQGYQARILGVREDEFGAYFSEPLEFLVQIVNGLNPVGMRMPRMPLDGALAMKRLHFGRNAIEIVGATPPSDSRLAAMLSVREYPTYTGPMLLDGLLKAPHEFIVSQSFAIVDRMVAQNQIERVSRQIAMADEAGSVIGSQLAGGRDELLSGRSIYGHHHLTVMCLGDDKAELDRCIRSVGADVDRPIDHLAARGFELRGGVLGAIAWQFLLYREIRDDLVEELLRLSFPAQFSQRSALRQSLGKRHLAVGDIQSERLFLQFPRPRSRQFHHGRAFRVGQDGGALLPYGAVATRQADAAMHFLRQRPRRRDFHSRAWRHL